MKRNVRKIISLVLAVTIAFGSLAMISAVIPASAETEYHTGDTVLYGSCPQSLVNDETVLDVLNGMTHSWIPYDYYSGDGELWYGRMYPNDFMEYTDVSVLGKTFRGVKISSYRPEHTYMENPPSDDYYGYIYQEYNGYYTDTVYWFEYEPIEWIILDAEEKLLLSKNVIDSQPFSNTLYEEMTTDKEGNYLYGNDYGDIANFYGSSSLINWAANFYEQYFDYDEKHYIKTTGFECENGDYGTYSLEEYVFFLSLEDVNNTDYGFNPEDRYYDSVSYAAGTDYALSQGLDITYGNPSWWLRDAGNGSDRAAVMGDYGYFEDETYPVNRVTATCVGVRPAIALEDYYCVKSADYYEIGDIVSYGSYPQTKVTDENLIEELNAKDTLWEIYDDYYWSRYYGGELETGDCMEYTDVTHMNKKYRGVRISEYRPATTQGSDPAANSYQDDNGYYAGNTYWFVYEQLEWIVIDPDEGLLLCRNIIDSQPYGTETFGEGRYFSYYDVTNGEYGFYPENREIDKVSFASGTDYALSQGLAVNNGRGEWWLDDSGEEPDTVYTMPVDTSAEYFERRTESTHIGVRPVVMLGSSEDFKDPSAFEYGDIITLGSYPQSEVTDEGILSQLNSQSHWWRSYKYYYGAEEKNNVTSGTYMKYADAYIGNQKYRGVIFSQYRPQNTDLLPNAENSYQDDNGYPVNYDGGDLDQVQGAYWFKYEPLEWIVVDPEESILMSKTIIDAQPFNNYKYDYPLYITGYGSIFYECFADADMNYRANRYDISTIREWLNDEFYSTAFTSREKEYISGNAYDEFNADFYNEWDYNPAVHDYVSLPSLDNLTIDGHYENSSIGNNQMMELPYYHSDYAKCQGLYVPKEGDDASTIWWWTRKESSAGESWVLCVQEEELSVSAHNVTDSVSTGVRPVIKYAPDGDAKKVYKNRYYANGGTFLLNNSNVWNQNVVEGLSIPEILQPVRDGYIFAGWEDSNGNTVKIPAQMDNSDHSYYAVWEDGSALQSDETLSIDVKIYRYDEAKEEWVETDRASSSETLKVRVFVDTTYCTNKGNITLFYRGVSGGFNTASNPVPNPDPESFAAKNGLVCTKGKYPQYSSVDAKMTSAGIITEWYDINYDHIIVDYSFDTDENRKISGDDWLFEFELKADGSFNESRVEVPVNTILNPFTATQAITDVPVGVEGGTAADNVSLAEVNVKKEVSGSGVISASAVTFDANGGIMPKNSQEIYVSKNDIGAKLTAVEPPVKEGDVFIGWIDENGNATQVPATFPYYDITLTAQWASEVHTVTYYLAKDAEPYKIETYAIGEDINYIMPENIPEGMRFNGWVDADGNPLPERMGETDIEAYAMWDINEHTVFFETHGGVPTDPVTKNYGELVYEPELPKKTGYIFAGWSYEDGTPVAFPFEMPDNDVEIHAKWFEAQYTISFNSQGGSPIESVTADFNTQIDAPENPERNGYNFIGWSYLPDDHYQSAMAVFPITVLAEDVELFAVWEAREYAVTYNIGEEKVEYSVAFGEKIPHPDMKKYEGVELAEWLDSNGEPAEIPSAMPANNIEFTAKLRYITVSEEFDVTVTFDDDCFSENVDLSIREINGESKLGDIYMVGSTSFRQVGFFNIKMINENEEPVQPVNGKKVTLRFPIPVGYGNNNEFLITHWLTDGGRERFSTEDGSAVIENGYIIISVGEFSEFSIHVKSMAKITKTPTKTSYAYREKLDLSGIEFTIKKNDGTIRKITDASKLNVKGFDPMTVGEQVIMVDYNGECASFTVTVNYTWWQWIIRILFLGIFWY